MWRWSNFSFLSLIFLPFFSSFFCFFLFFSFFHLHFFPFIFKLYTGHPRQLGESKNNSCSRLGLTQTDLKYTLIRHSKGLVSLSRFLLYLMTTWTTLFSLFFSFSLFVLCCSLRVRCSSDLSTFDLGHYTGCRLQSGSWHHSTVTFLLFVNFYLFSFLIFSFSLLSLQESESNWPMERESSLVIFWTEQKEDN